MKRVVIIGGSSAGTACAFELRKLDKNIEIIILEKSNLVGYSPCALPYVLSGEITSFEKIFVFKEKDYKENDISLKLNSEVVEIDRKNKILTYQTKNKKHQIDYDKLIIATGSSCVAPKIKGLEKNDYFKLKNITNAKEIAKKIKPGSSSVIIGVGFVGLELAFSLIKRGERVVLIEAKENILPTILDFEMAEKLKGLIENENLKIYEKAEIKEVFEDKIFLNDFEIKFGKLFVCCGVRSNLKLAEKINIDFKVGIIVNDYLKTSDEDIFACGDCAESVELNSGKKIVSALGTTATRQAKIIANNIATENQKKFPPVLNSTITRIDNVFVGSVGLTKKRSDELRIKTISAIYEGNVRSGYYSSKSKIILKIVSDIKGLLLGAQIVGNKEVVGKIDLISLAIQKGYNVKELTDFETCYNPAAASISNPIKIVSEICSKKVDFLNKV
jgi:NADH oxidase (H2O2-forming)